MTHREAGLTLTVARDSMPVTPGQVRPKVIPPGRADKIREILERYADLTEAVGGRGFAGSGTFVALMPHERSCMVTRSPSRECTCCRRCVVEIERLIKTMQQDRHRSLITLTSGEKVSVRRLWWNVTERYIAGRTHATTRHYLRGRWVDLAKNETIVASPPGTQLALADGRARKKAKPQAVPFPVAVKTWDAAVRPLLVDRAIQWIAAEWTLAGEPFVPRELIAA